MKLRYEHLDRERYPRLFRAFAEAFSDYVVSVSGLAEDALRNRWAKNAVDYEASVGAYDGDRLVGFMMLGIDEWEGRPAAFDAATGVVPGYRGFGVAPGMFDLALEGLRERAIRTFLLEVIQANKPAVRTYRKMGFRVTREFDCLRRAPARPGTETPDGAAAPADVVVERVGADLLRVFETFADWTPSWENGWAALRRIPDEVRLYGARRQGAWAGFAAYYPGLRWLMNVVVDRRQRRRGVGAALLDRVLRDLPPETAEVKLLNVERTDAATLSWAAASGFASYALQYEMALEI